MNDANWKRGSGWRGKKIPKKILEKRVSTMKQNLLRTLPERFKLRINKKKSGCWEWVGTVNRCKPDKNGYGIFKVIGKRVRAHRFSWILFRGKIPKGKGVLHKCDNRICVNPKHLFLGTQLDNMKDRFRKGRIVVNKKR